MGIHYFPYFFSKTKIINKVYRFKPENYIDFGYFNIYEKLEFYAKQS